MLYFPLGVIILALIGFAFFQFKMKHPASGQLNAKHSKINAGKYYTVLAQQGNTPVFIPEHSRYMHTQVIGSTGSGKTRYVFYPSIYQDITRGAGCFILDVKSNMLTRVGEFVQQANRFDDFYFFDIESSISSSYNPLLGDDPNEVASRICTALYSNSERSEQFYKEIGYRFITSLVRLLYTFTDRITFVMLYECANNFEILRDKCSQRPGNLDAEYFMANWINLSDNKRQQQLMGLINKLYLFVSSKWSNLINTTDPDIVMDEIVLNNKILLFGVSSQQYTNEYKAISILTLMNLQNVIAKRYGRKNNGAFFVYLDEFKDIVYPQFADLINKAREARVGLMLGHQSLGDLNSIDKSFENIILTNSRNKIILNLDNVETAEYFSKLIGTKKSIEKVDNYARDGIWNVAKGYSLKTVDEFIVHPNILKTMPSGAAVLRIAVAEEGVRHFTVMLQNVGKLPTLNLGLIKNRKELRHHNYSKPDVIKEPLVVEKPIINATEDIAPKIKTSSSRISFRDKIYKPKKTKANKKSNTENSIAAENVVKE